MSDPLLRRIWRPSPDEQVTELLRGLKNAIRSLRREGVEVLEIKVRPVPLTADLPEVVDKVNIFYQK